MIMIMDIPQVVSHRSVALASSAFNEGNAWHRMVLLYIG
jgi:hypothetical protein